MLSVPRGRLPYMSFPLQQHTQAAAGCHTKCWPIVRKRQVDSRCTESSCVSLSAIAGRTAASLRGSSSSVRQLQAAFPAVLRTCQEKAAADLGQLGVSELALLTLCDISLGSDKDVAASED